MTILHEELIVAAKGEHLPEGERSLFNTISPI